MQPPAIKKFNMEDYPGAPQWMLQVFLQLNNALGGFFNVLSRQVSRGDNLAAADARDIAFTTKATASDTFPLQLKWTTAQAPVHVVCSKLQRADGKAQTSAFSMTWSVAQGGLLNLWFQGLDASTGYTASVVYE